jgi:site-specific DNA-cytosine methylase
MRILSTFSGISAATAAWRPLGWKIVGYAEIDSFACAVLSERYHATPPKYLADPHDDAIEEDGFALSVRLSKAEGGVRLPPRLLRHLKPGIDPASLTKCDIEKLWWREYDKAADMGVEERNRRETTVRGHRRHPVRKGGAVPNFGDIWYITDDDLEALGPVDMLEGGSPCQAFSVAGDGQGMTDHRSALMLAYLDLIERMKQINGLKWVLWENVKGVLSDKGNGFGCLLAALAGGKGINCSLQGKDGQTRVTCLDREARWPGESSTVNTSVFPNDASPSLLSRMLETGLPPSTLEKYSLSAAQKAGVLRRAEARGKPLSAFLETALKT